MLHEHAQKWLLIPFLSFVCVSSLCRSKMEESTPPSSSQCKSVLVLSPVAMLARRDQYGELVLSPRLPVWRRREGGELVCSSACGVTDRQTDRQTQESVAKTGPVWSEGMDVQEGGGARQQKWYIKVEEGASSEPDLAVDSDMEPNTVAIQETKQN